MSNLAWGAARYDPAGLAELAFAGRPA